MQKTCENLSAQFHTRVGKMIGSNTDDGGSKSNELEFLLWSWLGDDSIFSQGSKSYYEVLQGPFLKEDKDLASDLSEPKRLLVPPVRISALHSFS